MERVAQRLGQFSEAFLLAKRVSGCTEHTLGIYRLWLGRFTQEVGDSAPIEPVAAHRFVASWQDRAMKPATIHRGVRALRAFFRWCVAAGSLADDPLRGLTIRLPKTLPDVPTEEELRAVLIICSDTLEGIRNRTLILTLADAGLRASEALHLLCEDWRPTDRGLFIRSGKGKKDRMVFVGPTTTRALKAWLARHPLPAPESFLFVDRQGRPLKRRHLIQILHRLSHRAGLPAHRRLHPHALRHFAATSWLRNGVGLDEVRRLLGHESLATTLRYSSLVSADLQAAHKTAGAIERMRLG